jgi:hypothetical protein
MVQVLMIKDKRLQFKTCLLCPGMKWQAKHGPFGARFVIVQRI